MTPLNPDWDPLKTLEDMSDQLHTQSIVINELAQAHNNVLKRVYSLEQAYIEIMETQVKTLKSDTTPNS